MKTKLKSLTITIIETQNKSMKTQQTCPHRPYSRIGALRSISWILFGGLILAGGAAPAHADFITSHQGATDPLTEGFSVAIVNSLSTTGPLPNCLDLPAWMITGSAQNSQLWYRSGALTPAQQADIASQGFALTLVARAVQGQAPAYDVIDNVVILGAALDTGARRFEIQLGLNANGDTVVVLPGQSVGKPERA